VDGTPRVSILIPAYNAARTVGETLDSVLAQTSPDWEAIVVDDGSTDDTLAVAQEYAAADTRIRVLSQRNAGSAGARNAALAASHADLLCLLDADDLYAPDYVEEQSAFIAANPDYDIYSCNARAVTPDGTLGAFNAPQSHEEAVSFTFDDMIQDNRIAVFAVFRRRVFDAIGGFDPAIYVEDYDYWLRALSAGFKHLHNPKSLVQYRVREDGKTADWMTANRGVATVLQRVVRDGGLTRSQRDAARERIRAIQRNLGIELRRQLEGRFVRGDFAGGRSAQWRARAGYASRLKFAVVLALTMISPVAYRAAFLRGREEDSG
jgi:glycosyltransferase involved in cell wall biosynthesis